MKYTIIPSPKRDEVPVEILDELGKKQPIKDIIQKMKEKQKEAHVVDGTWEKEQERKKKLKEEIDSVKGGGIDNYPDEEITASDIPF